LFYLCSTRSSTHHYFSRPNPAIDFKTSLLREYTAHAVEGEGRAAPGGCAFLRHWGYQCSRRSRGSARGSGFGLVRPWHFCCLSAGRRYALEAAIRNFAAYFQRHPMPTCGYCLHVSDGRRAFCAAFFLFCNNAKRCSERRLLTPRHRLIFSARSLGTTPPGNRSLAFLFPGLVRNARIWG